MYLDLCGWMMYLIKCYTRTETENLPSSEGEGEGWGGQAEESVQVGQIGVPPAVEAQPPGAKRKVKPSLPLCGVVGAANFVQGGIIGAGFGLVMGGYQGYEAGLRAQSLRAYTWGRVKSSAFSFAAWLGAYRGVKCSMMVLRGKRDWVNGAVAGGVAGMLPAIPTRDPRLIGISFLSSAALMGLLEGLETVVTGKPAP
jgi:hypothetical protein